MRAASNEGIRIEGLTKRFGEIEAVSNFSLDIEPGEIFGLLPEWRGQDHDPLAARHSARADGWRRVDPWLPSAR